MLTLKIDELSGSISNGENYGYAVINFNWCCIYINEVLSGLAGIPAVECVDKSIFQLVAGAKANPLYPLLYKTMVTRIPQQASFKVLSVSDVWYDIKILPVPEGIFIQVADITASKIRQDDLSIDESFYRTAFMAVDAPLIITSVEGERILEVNDKFLLFFNVLRSQIIGRTTPEAGLVIPEEDMKEITRLLNTDGRVTDYEVTVQLVNDVKKRVCISSTRFNTKLGDKYITIITDITASKKHQKRIQTLLNIAQSSNAHLNTIFNSIPDALFAGSEEGIVKFNINALQLLGTDSRQLTGMKYENLVKKFDIRHETGEPCQPGELPMVKALMGRNSIEEMIIKNNISGRDANIRLACAPIMLNKKVAGVIAIATDITGKKLSEKTVNSLLNEKELLLQETYHRTKNNMQIISSLLTIKADSLNNPELTDIVNDVRLRIQALSLVHQKLYQSQNYASVDLSVYLKELITNIRASYQAIRNSIIIKSDLVKVDVNIDQAIACGLVITELVTNSMKYAFPFGRPGEINVILKQQGSLILLSVADNGVGINESDLSDTKLGIQLVRMIAKDKLNAEAILTTDNGVRWSIIFQQDKT